MDVPREKAKPCGKLVEVDLTRGDSEYWRSIAADVLSRAREYHDQCGTGLTKIAIAVVGGFPDTRKGEAYWGTNTPKNKKDKKTYSCAEINALLEAGVPVKSRGDVGICEKPITVIAWNAGGAICDPCPKVCQPFLRSLGAWWWSKGKDAYVNNSELMSEVAGKWDIDKSEWPSGGWSAPRAHDSHRSSQKRTYGSKDKEEIPVKPERQRKFEFSPELGVPTSNPFSILDSDSEDETNCSLH